MSDSSEQIDWSRIKNELQGSEGLIRLVRSDLMGDSTEAADETFAAYCEEFGTPSQSYLREHFSEVLGRLIDFSSRLYRDRSDLIAGSLLRKAAKREGLRTTYPETYRALDHLQEIYASRSDFQSFLSTGFPILANLLKLMTISERQSSVKRAGLMFSSHIGRLLRLVGLEGSFQRNVSLSSNVPPLDFVFPSVVYYQQAQPQTAAVAAVITTINDRYRISTTKLSVAGGAKRYLVTGVGSSFPHSAATVLTEARLSHLGELSTKAVVLDSAKSSSQRLSGDERVVSFEQWVGELLGLKKEHWKCP